jgi:hypothetical protein
MNRKEILDGLKQIAGAGYSPPPLEQRRIVQAAYELIKDLPEEKAPDERYENPDE